MKHDTQEVAAVEEAIAKLQSELSELAEHQLALVGGGVGEVVIC
ncbi:MAG TPA: hypothetical protein VEC19_17390 [Usitatibacter sp.]|nr:hypothetical protein [Usitatibacter sp.]